MRAIQKIIIHCAATIEGKFYNAKDIDKWHLQKGWSGIGYHYVILIDGTIEKGRAIERIGAHTKGHNSTSIGICYIGGLGVDRKAKDTRTDKQIASMLGLLDKLKNDYPGATIHGHNEFANKACPSFNVSEWIKTTEL